MKSESGSSTNRDEFGPSTKRMLALRVGHKCSNPSCSRSTSGPQTDRTKAIIIGVAAHITGAAKGGPRYDPTLTPEERKHINNGIWLCQSCGKLVDDDKIKYTSELLQNWKELAERAALSDVETLPSQPNDKSVEILARIENLSSSGFEEINRRLSQIEELFGLFTNSSGLGSAKEEEPEKQQSKTFQSLGPSSGIEGLRYIVLGLSDKELIPWFNLFSDDPKTIPTDLYQEVCFRDFREMQNVFKVVQIVIEKAKALEDKGSDPVEAKITALQEVSIVRGRMYLARKKGPKRRKSSVKIPGLKYIIYGVEELVAEIILPLRTKEWVEGPSSIKRNAEEVYFRNIYSALKVPQIINGALEKSNNDTDEFIGWLFEGVMRLKTLGPEAEMFSEGLDDICDF